MKKTASILTVAVLTAALAVPFSAGAEENLVYGTMNIPYADFYASELENDTPVDAVSSATTSKWKANQTGSVAEDGTWKAGGLAAGTYNDGEGTILGVTYPVAVAAADVDKIPASYSFTELAERPAAYKTVTVQGGALSFGKIEDADGAESITSDVTLSVTPWMGDYELTVANYPQNADLYGVILETSDGKSYGLRTLENIWRKGEIAWTTGVKLKESHGNTLNPTHYADMQGKTIQKITYITLNGYSSVEGLSIYLPLKTVDALTVENGKSGTGSVTFDTSVLPAAYAQSGKVADGFTVSGGTVSYENALPGSYTLTMSDTSGVYADVTGSFTLTTEDVPVQYADGKLIAAEGFTEADAANFIKNISSVQVGENTYKTGHHGTTVIDSKTGEILWDAASGTNAVFGGADSYTLTVTATGYENTLTFDAAPAAAEESTAVSESTTAVTTTTVTTTAVTTVTEAAETTAPVITSTEQLLEWAKIDCEKKTGIAVYPEAEELADGSVRVTLKDADGKVVDTYTVDAATGIGTDAKGGEVNLPQTGVTSPAAMAAAAGGVMTLVAGAYLALRSGMVRRKRED